MALNDHTKLTTTTIYQKVRPEEHVLTKEIYASQLQSVSVSPQSQLASLPPKSQSAVIPPRIQPDSLPPITQPTSPKSQSQLGSNPAQSNSVPLSSSGFRANVKRDSVPQVTQLLLLGVQAREHK